MSMHIGFLTDMSFCPWGGSEELWSQTAGALLQRGCRVSACVHPWPQLHPKLTALELQGLEITTRDFRKEPLSKRLSRRLLPYRYHPMIPEPGADWIERTRPDLIVHSMSHLYSCFDWMDVCVRADIPYANLVQQVNDHFWFYDHSLPRNAELMQGARRCFFVSRHNHLHTEEALAAALPNAEVVHNPINVPFDANPAYPTDTSRWKLACVARLEPQQKGQDLLLRVLDSDKWRTRPMEVSLFGGGSNRTTLQYLAHKLRLDNVHFCGHTDNIVNVWRDHHALVLPSRVEGLPLALVEALLCGRTAICTPAGGIPEVLEDNVTGFLAAAATVEYLDQALERAWQRRNEWQSIGQLAATRIRQLIPHNPAAAFADRLLNLAQ